ncbi:MAG: hypothetical protein ACO1OD_13995, partial [Croceibacterium sp.]
MSFADDRLAAGYTLDAVARDFAVSLAQVREWEAGRAKAPPRVANALRELAKYAEPRADGIKPAQPEFTAIRDEGPLFRSDKLIKSK